MSRKRCASASVRTDRPERRSPSSPTACPCGPTRDCRGRRPCSGRWGHRCAAELLVVEGRDRAIVDAVADEVLIAEYIEADPCRLFVPLRVMALMPPPAKPPCRTSYRRHDELQFLNGVEADRLGLRRAARACRRRGDAEQVVVHRAVDLEVVVTRVTAGHRQCGVDRR